GSGIQEVVAGGAVAHDRGVGIVGVVADVGGVGEVKGAWGVDDGGFEAGGGDVHVHGAMIRAGLLGGDDRVAEVMLGDGPLEVGDGGVESRAGVLDGGQGDEDAAVEVGEQPGGA